LYLQKCNTFLKNNLKSFNFFWIGGRHTHRATAEVLGGARRLVTTEKIKKTFSKKSDKIKKGGVMR
jgi:hypothetical protein